MTAPEQPPPFVFVLGAGRSGTSVLRSVLDGHSRLAVSHEGRFVFPLSRRRAGTNAPRASTSTPSRPTSSPIRRSAATSASNPTTCGSALGGAPVADYPDAVRRVFAHYPAQRGKSRYGDKMPAYVLRIPALA